MLQFVDDCSLLFLDSIVSWRVGTLRAASVQLNPNRSVDCSALMKPSFCHLFSRFSATMPPHCALKVAKHLFKNKSYYHHNANDRCGLNQQDSAERIVFVFLFVPPSLPRTQA